MKHMILQDMKINKSVMLSSRPKRSVVEGSKVPCHAGYKISPFRFRSSRDDTIKLTGQQCYNL